MKIESVNVSTVKSIEHNGKIIETGFFKTPTANRVAVSQINIEGDQQADLKNHGGPDKAVYAFAADHYHYWQTELGLGDMLPGQFGENLTIKGLLETDVKIGDRYSVGDLLIEVSQPRVPCFKLGIRFNDTSMPKRFVSRGHTGVYFRVISTGHITQGDSLILTHREAESVSVHALFNAFYNCSDKQYVRDMLVKCLTLDALADEWRRKINRKLSRPHS